MARWKIGPAHPNQSRSHCLALGTRTRADTQTHTHTHTRTHIHTSSRFKSSLPVRSRPNPMRRRVWASFQHFYHTLLRIQSLVSASWGDVNLVLVGETETRLDGQWLVWACCDATDVCLVHALGSRASPWGLAGFDVIGVGPKIVARGAAKGANGMWISSAFRYPGHRFMRRENAASTWGFGSKMCSRMQ